MTFPLTVQAALHQGQSTLFYAEVDTPLLDATVLLAEALGVSKEKLLSSLEELVDEGAYRRFRAFLDLRCSGMPVSYIRNKKEFFSLEFYVDRRVLVPRPDTEILVEEALRILEQNPGLRSVHDACTGCGCVAIALKNSRPELEVSASDLFPAAGEVFRINSRYILGHELPFLISDLLTDLNGMYDLITANPPYLADREVDALKKIGWPEPEDALRGGSRGTALLERLIRQAPDRLRSPGYLLVEAAPDQMDYMRGLLRNKGFQEIVVVPDLAGRQRVIKARL